MMGEELAHFADAVQDAVGEAAVAEVGADFGGNLLPEFAATLLVDAFVADDGKLSGPRGEVEEDGVALAGGPHAELDKALLGALHGIGNFAAGDKDADLPGGDALRFANGADVDTTIVGGRILMRARRLVDHNEDAILDRAERAFHLMMERAGLA